VPGTKEDYNGRVKLPRGVKHASDPVVSRHNEHRDCLLCGKYQTLLHYTGYRGISIARTGNPPFTSDMVLDKDPALKELQ